MRVKGLERRLNLSTGIVEFSKGWEKGKRDLNFATRTPTSSTCLSPLKGCTESVKQICNTKLGRDDQNETIIYA
jgi:hypothetical protein